MKKYKIATDLVKEKIGEIKPDVIYQDDYKRVILAKNLENRVGAYSIVHFEKLGKTLMPEIHEKIMKGKFIGETFREHGVATHREEECLFVYSLPLELRKIFGCFDSHSNSANLGDSRTYDRESFCKRVLFKVGDNKIPYASIVEIYSPRVSFDSLFENKDNSVKKTISELEKEFNDDEGIHYIHFLNENNIGEYLDLAHNFLVKPMHLGIEDSSEFVRETFNTGLELIKDKNTISLIAEKNDEFIGYISANIHPALHLAGYECMVRELYVKENFRRNGVASSLIRTMEKIALERKSKRISLVTNMDDSVQNTFYSSLDFRKRCDFAVKYL